MPAESSAPPAFGPARCSASRWRWRSPTGRHFHRPLSVCPVHDARRVELTVLSHLFLPKNSLRAQLFPPGGWLAGRFQPRGAGQLGEPHASRRQMGRADPRPYVSVSARVDGRAPACRSCAERPDRPCRSCAARRRVAARLFEHDGLSIDEIARRMRLNPLRVMRLLEQSCDRRLGEAVRCPPIGTSVVRERFHCWRSANPGVRTFTELARLAGYDSSSHIQRLLGEIPTSAVVKGEVVYPGRRAVTISCENGGRLVRAMGYAPVEVPGL